MNREESKLGPMIFFGTLLVVLIFFWWFLFIPWCQAGTLRRRFPMSKVMVWVVSIIGSVLFFMF